MTFGDSAILKAMHAIVSKDVVAKEVTELLKILGESDPNLTEELIRGDVRAIVVAELKTWNSRLSPNSSRDSLGVAATKFWAAQALVNSLMSENALDLTTRYSDGLVRAMRIGAEGLFEVGRLQFDALGKMASQLVSWIVEQKLETFTILEAPLGNTLPVQIIKDLAEAKGLSCNLIEWNAPRNDRPSRGHTVEQSAKELSDATKDAPLVVFTDDAITGTRFVKLFDALLPKIGERRFLPIVMGFDDPWRHGLANNPNRERFVMRVMGQGAKLNYPQPIVPFPLQRLFKTDEGNPARWQFPITLENSDLIAGKRKVNLIFTLLNHCLEILRDLAKEKSKYRL